jgi:dTDP-4-amino-4,6-dideoxygalactose transaminase
VNSGPPSNQIFNSVRSGPTLHVGAPNIGDRATFDRLVDEMFQRRWFTNHGKIVQEFEQRLRDHLKVKHCITVSNATVGLQLACRALDLTGEVILPSFTFVATPHAVAWQGLTPVFADIDPATHCLCPDSVESLVTDQTSAIMAVHLWGEPCATKRLQAIADRHGVKLIYDAAHAFHCESGGQMIGNFGDCEVFSFHATKFFNTFEGGAIATNDDQLAQRIYRMKNFGIAGPEEFDGIGTNAKLSEIAAAMGLSMFERIDQIASCNRSNHLRYATLLADVPGITIRSFNQPGQRNWQYVVAEIDADAFGCGRDQLLSVLHQNAILARRYFFPGCHRLKVYADQFNQSGRTLPNTDWVAARVLCLPTGTAMGQQDIDQVCEIILQAHQRAFSAGRNQAA